VHARQPRHQVDRARHLEVTNQFLSAAWSGDLDGMVSLLAPDVELVSDGGGKKKAALRPMRGPDKICRWALALLSPDQDAYNFEVRLTELNGEDAFVFYDGDEVDSAGFFQLDADGRISQIYIVRNPDKLTMIPRRSELG
jgi:RNA polymerase sigma-70 factor (ECF subfamily)